MSQDIRNAALERLEAARKEVVRLENFIATFDEIAVATQTRVHPLAEAAKGLAAVVERIGHIQEAGRLSLTERVARQIISEHGGPVPTPIMLDRIVERGVEVGGASPSSTLSARLSRAPTLKFERGLGWALNDAPSSNEKAADPAPARDESAASAEPTNDAVERGEVEYDNMTE